MALVRLSLRVRAKMAPSFGKFLAKLVPLMEDVQQSGCVMFASE